jgi:VWFA-related protein
MVAVFVANAMRHRFLIATFVAAGAARFVSAGGGGPADSARQDAAGPPMFTARSELVVLHVTVTDRRSAYVPDLPADAFLVLEDERPQTIAFFAAQDAPVTVGLVIDNSGSMLGPRDRIVAAAGAFVETSNPQDDIFGLLFDERVRAVLPPEAPFTGDAETMRRALAGAIQPRGRTALHDAVLAGLDYVERGHQARKVLVVVGDGGDNASVATFDEVLRRSQSSNTAIYTIAVIDPLEREANPGHLRQIANITGGAAFRPRRITDVADALKHISREIRHAYTIGYMPADAGEDGHLRTIRVIARRPGHRALSVRTRQGYRRNSD